MQGTQPGPDRRVADYLANERTFLAWVRTSISIIGLGFVVAKFGLWLRELALHLDLTATSTVREPSASLPIGMAMMVFGGFLTLLATHRYGVINCDIDAGRPSARQGLVFLLTGGVVGLTTAMIIYMFFTSKIF